MNNLIISLNAVLPLFLCMVLGYFFRLLKLYDSHTLEQMNKLCFKVFLPFSLFKSVSSTDLAAAFNGKLIIFAVSSLFILFAVLMIVVPKVTKDNKRRGAFIQAIFRSNFVLFGLPLAASICGDAKLGPTSLLIGIVTPIYNVLAVVTLEIFRGGKASPKKILKGIVTNPLIIVSVLGILVSLSGITLPAFADKTISDIGKIATPLSLIVLGGEFVISRVSANRKSLIAACLLKLAIVPAAVCAAAVFFGFRNEMLVPVVIMFGAPSAVSSFTMARTMDSDADFASQTVVFTTLLSVVSMFFWIFALKQLSLI